jgi:hypothetical protein
MNVKSTTGVVHLPIERISASGYPLTWCMARVTPKWEPTEEKLTCPHCIRGNGYKP